MANTKKYFDTKKEAIKIMKERNGFGSTNSVFKIKRGRNKGKFFVGMWIEWVNLE